MREKRRAGQRRGLYELAYTGMFAAVLAVLSVIAIPMPSGVPLTLQTFGVALCGAVLGRKYGTMSVGLYLLVGAAGMPVFSGMRGGLGVLAGPTGGFLIGFLFLAFFCGWGSRRRTFFKLGFGICGLLLCHLFGILQFAAVSGRSFSEGLLAVSLPYLAKDALSVAAAFVAAKALRKGLALAGVALVG